MNEIIYIARRENLRSGNIEQSFDLLYTFDLDLAKRACDMEHRHLTERERRNTRFCVAGYSVPCDPDTTATDAYNAWADALYCLPDPEYFDEVG